MTEYADWPILKAGLSLKMYTDSKIRKSIYAKIVEMKLLIIIFGMKPWNGLRGRGMKPWSGSKCWLNLIFDWFEVLPIYAPLPGCSGLFSATRQISPISKRTKLHLGA
jgi:hypothetical protein